MIIYPLEFKNFPGRGLPSAVLVKYLLSIYHSEFIQNIPDDSKFFPFVDIDHYDIINDVNTFESDSLARCLYRHFRVDGMETVRAICH